MCGSSTIAIEAALLATNRRPGLYRSNYAFMHLQGFEEKMYTQQRELLDEIITTVPGLKIIATDISTDAVNISKINAGAAGVDSLVQFAVGDFELTEIPEDQPGVIYFNPEYGDRLGVEAELEITYGRIGDFMKKKCKGYTGYIFYR
jgi:putative N6-adenine-specific DNA methylase